ncbi:MAG: translation elongation factor 4 [Desulfohalobiaceae bacterium]
MRPEKRQLRNFSIIAHIDHGKSTLADRILELTGLVSGRDKKDQFLDRMDLERERGITIKSQTVRLPYRAADGRDYILNLIDTPGHVDFNYEVSRSLAACEGALLLIDASQGVEAQTMANVYLALDNDLEIIPVLNKVDLPGAEPELIIQDIEEAIGLDCTDILQISAKTGLNTEQVLERIVRQIPRPQGIMEDPLKALIFDSWYDPYQGVVVLFRIFNGFMQQGQRIMMFSNQREFEIHSLGVFSPNPQQVEWLGPGEVGFMFANVKDLSQARVGDTITWAHQPVSQPCPGFKKIQPMVFCGLYPTEPAKYDPLKKSLERLSLNDTSFSFDPETSQALGFGFRCGFLGLLHMDIIQERLEREFQAELIATAPSVVYQAHKKDGTVQMVDNPSLLPDPKDLESIAEPYVRMEIHVPNEYVGNVLKLCEEKRGLQKDLRYLTSSRVIITYELPFAEIVFDFFDQLKSLTRGYASLDYEFIGFFLADLVRLDILINSEPVDSMASIVHRNQAYYQGRKLAQKLKQLIPRQLFEVIIQACISHKVVARERVAPLRKNVTAKCYGGDITRKRKLLEKQKEGKRRMKKMGNIELPQEAFLAALKKDES